MTSPDDRGTIINESGPGKPDQSSRATTIRYQPKGRTQAGHDRQEAFHDDEGGDELDQAAKPIQQSCPLVIRPNASPAEARSRRSGSHREEKLNSAAGLCGRRQAHRTEDRRARAADSGDHRKALGQPDGRRLPDSSVGTPPVSLGLTTFSRTRMAIPPRSAPTPPPRHWRAKARLVTDR